MGEPGGHDVDRSAKVILGLVETNEKFNRLDGRLKDVMTLQC